MPDWMYKALLIGNAVFTGPKGDLPQLLGPPNDVPNLYRALTDTQTGLHLDSNVQVLTDCSYAELRKGIAAFLSTARGGEQVLLYYSGHGRRTQRGELCLCARDTDTTDDITLQTTAIESRYLADLMRECRATAKVIVLDCCYAGAFDQRFKSGELPYHLQGQGQFGLYSTHVYEQAPDAMDIEAMSPFTQSLVEALSLGTLDRDDDGFVDFDDVYRYVLDALRRRRVSTPTRSMPGPTVGTVALARSLNPLPAAARVVAPSPSDPWRLPASLILPVGPPPLVPVPPDEPMFRMAWSLVTNRQFAQFLSEEQNAGWRPGGDLALEFADEYYLRHWSDGGFPAQLSEHPVVNVSAFAAHAYAGWASRRWGLGLRLPHRAEWEVASRAGRPAEDYLELDLRDGLIDYNRTDRALMATDALPANRYGVANLLGNAADLCLPDGAPDPSGDVYALGGTFRTPRQLLLAPIRMRPRETRDDVGFRCVQPTMERL